VGRHRALLHLQRCDLYHWTDVANVTAHAVDPAGAALLPASTRYIAQVAVPTADNGV